MSLRQRARLNVSLIRSSSSTVLFCESSSGLHKGLVIPEDLQTSVVSLIDCAFQRATIERSSQRPRYQISRQCTIAFQCYVRSWVAQTAAPVLTKRRRQVGPGGTGAIPTAGRGGRAGGGRRRGWCSSAGAAGLAWPAWHVSCAAHA
jgi:hypothetical protein